MTALLAVLAFVGGACFGSFANVVIYRVPLGQSVVAPRSACPSCSTPIGGFDNIPLLSFLLLRGRCRACGQPISWRYPLVEALVGALWVAMLLRIGVHPVLPAYLALVTVIVMLSAIDVEHHRLPNAILGPGFIAAVVLLVVAAAAGGDWSPLAHAAIGAGIYGGTILLIHLAVPAGMGFGDVKFAPYLGLHLGWLGLFYVPVGMLLGFMAGAAGGILLIALGLRTRKDRIAFGPFMATGTVLMILAGSALHRLLLP